MILPHVTWSPPSHLTSTKEKTQIDILGSNTPEFDFIEHDFGFFMGQPYQGLLVNGDKLVSWSQAAILRHE